MKIIKVIAFTSLFLGCSDKQKYPEKEMDGVVETLHVLTTPDFYEPFSLYDYHFSNDILNLLVLTKNHVYEYFGNRETNKTRLSKSLSNVYSVSLGMKHGFALNTDSCILVHDNKWHEFNIIKISRGKIVGNPKSKILLDQANHRVIFDGISYSKQDRKRLFDYNHIFSLDYITGEISTIQGIRHSEILINGLKEEPITYFHLTEDNRIIVSESHDKFIYEIKQNKVQKYFVQTAYDSTLASKIENQSNEIESMKKGLFRFNYLNATLNKNKVIRLFRFQRPEKNKFGHYTFSSMSKVGLMQYNNKISKSNLVTKLPENTLFDPNHVSFSSNSLVTTKDIIYDKIHNHWIFIFSFYRFNGL
jgi:hypothetical protein